MELSQRVRAAEEARARCRLLSSACGGPPVVRLGRSDHLLDVVVVAVVGGALDPLVARPKPDQRGPKPVIGGERVGVAVQVATDEVGHCLTVRLGMLEEPHERIGRQQPLAVDDGPSGVVAEAAPPGQPPRGCLGGEQKGEGVVDEGGRRLPIGSDEWLPPLGGRRALPTPARRGVFRAGAQPQKVLDGVLGCGCPAQGAQRTVPLGVRTVGRAARPAAAAAQARCAAPGDAIGAQGYRQRVERYRPAPA